MESEVMDFTDMLSQEEQLILAREGDDDMAMAQAQDLEARRARCGAILAKAAAVLTHDELDALRYECGLEQN